MMNILEEAVIYSTIMHQGRVRKFGGRPYILHPMEVAQILSTITDDEVITAGILHDIVEDTDSTLEEIEKRFGERVAHLVTHMPLFPARAIRGKKLQPLFHTRSQSVRLRLGRDLRGNHNLDYRAFGNRPLQNAPITWRNSPIAAEKAR